MLVPTDDSLVENFHGSMASFVEHTVRQTGEVVRASSIQNSGSISWNALDMIAEMVQRR